MSIELQYQSSFYKPKTYKDMEETLFKLTRAITDTGIDTAVPAESRDTAVPAESCTITYRITSLKRKLANGKVVSTSTPSCTLSSASVSWAIWGGVTVRDGYLDVKINYSENNTGFSRSTTLIFTQNESNNKINLTVTQVIRDSIVTYSGYIKPVSNTLPLGGNKGKTAQILVMAYLNGSDGSKKPETLHVGSAPNWCSVSVAQVDTPENHYMLTLTALSNNNSGANRSEHILLTCGDANLSIPVTQSPSKITANIKIILSKSPTSNTSANCDILSDQQVASAITLRIQIQYGISLDYVREYTYTLAKGSAMSRRNSFPIQEGANPQVIDYDYFPQEDSKYIYSVTIRR